MVRFSVLISNRPTILRQGRQGTPRHTVLTHFAVEENRLKTKYVLTPDQSDTRCVQHAAKSYINGALHCTLTPAQVNTLQEICRPSYSRGWSVELTTEA